MENQYQVAENKNDLSCGTESQERRVVTRPRETTERGH